MITQSPPRRASSVLVAAAVLASGAILVPAASAAPGAAPAPKEYRVLQDVHTDAVSTFLDDGVLELGTKADVAEGNGTRFDEDDLWFHVDNDSRMTLPAGFEFIAPGGSEVWISPQSSPGPTQLWPGFSTESVPLGAIDGNSTTFTLVDVAGPGELELFTTGSFGSVSRIWSSDEPNLDTLTVGRVHMHANWAFTAAGQYDITVQAAVAVGGVQQTDTATYTFIVGDVPEASNTTTSLGLSATEILVGDTLTATATVAPAVDGYVEFFDGEQLLGHEQLVDGRATTALDLGVGTREITAAFVPAVTNLAEASTSSVVSVTVADGSGLEFGIRGIEDSYNPGDTVNARIVGYTLGENESFRWRTRSIPTGSFWTYAQGTDRLELPIDVSFAGWEVRAQVYNSVTGQVVAETASYPLTVTSILGAPGLTWVDGPDVFLGSSATATIAPPDGMQDGDTIVAAFRQNTAWLPADYRPTIDGTTLTHALPFNMVGNIHLQVVRDGVVISQSEGYTTTHKPREVLVQGAQGIYRAGQTLDVTATVYPMAESLSYVWRFRDGSGAATTTTAVPDENGVLRFSRELTLADDGGDLRLQAEFPTVFGFASSAGSKTIQLHVSDAAPDEQLVALNSLAGHYHQGNTINLQLVADPAPADTDVIEWQWRWPGGEWESIEGFDSATESLVAEQALDNVEIRAILMITGEELSYIAGPVTIDVDDHGAAPSQKVTLSGAEDRYTAGEDIELTASVAPSSVLDRWEWWVTREGETAEVIEGENGPTLSLGASEELDGATVVARLTFDDGTPYVESAAVLLAVDPAVEEPIETTITISGLADHYHTGDTMTLTASQDPDTGEDHWHWFIRAEGAADWSVIPAQATSTLTRTVLASDDGASVIARLYDHDHAVIAESDPVVVTVDDHHGEEPPPADGKPEVAPAPQRADSLGSTPAGGIELGSATVPQGGTLVIETGDEHGGEWLAAWLFSEPTLLGGDWVQANSAGSFAVTVPLDTETGAHRVAVFDADDELVGWASVTVTAAPTAPAQPGGLASTGSDVSALWLGVPVLAVGVALLLAARRRSRVSG